VAIVTVTVQAPSDIRSLVRAAYAVGLPGAEFSAAVEGGQPVYEAELFGDREFHEVADELETLVGMLRKAGASFVIREAGFEITPEVLANILTTGRDRFRPPLV
jgi:hypothetical protein